MLSSLDDLVRAGKVRYVGVSNFSGWQVMNAGYSDNLNRQALNLPIHNID